MFITLYTTACFYGEKLLTPRQTAKLEDHPLPAFHDWLFAVILQIWKPSRDRQPEDAPCLGDTDRLSMIWSLPKDYKVSGKQITWHNPFSDICIRICYAWISWFPASCLFTIFTLFFFLRTVGLLQCIQNFSLKPEGLDREITVKWDVISTGLNWLRILSSGGLFWTR